MVMASMAYGQSTVKSRAGQDFNNLCRQSVNFIDPIAAQRGMVMPKADGPTQEYITTQPEGELKTYVRSGEYVSSVMGGLVEGSQNGKTMKVVFAPDGKTVWFDKMIAASSATFGWIKGEIEGNNIIIEPGQYAWFYDYVSYYLAYTVKRIVPNPNGSASSYDTYMTSEGNIVFSIGEDGTLTLQPDENGVAAIGLIRETNDQWYVDNGYDGKWLGYGDMNTVYTPFEENFNEGPAEGTEMQDCSMTYNADVEGTTRMGHMAKMAVVGDKVYIQGASQYLPNAWLIGQIDGDKVVIDKQMTGVLDNYYVYFRGAEVVKQQNPETGEDEYFYSPIDQLVFDYDAANQTLTTEDCLVLSTDEFMVAEGYMVPEINLFEDVPMQPATPIVGEDYIPYDADYGSFYITVCVPSVDVDGKFLDPSKLTYSVYVDDELFTFDPSFYFYFEQPVTEIPYGYYEDYRFQNLGAGRYAIEINKEPTTNVCVKSFYAGGGAVTESEMGVFNLPQTGIATINSSQVKSVTYYNLAGMRSDTPFSGMNIVVKTYEDGTTSTTKMIRK